MSERVLWLRLCVTGPTPECGEIVGLRIVDRQGGSTRSSIPSGKTAGRACRQEG